MTRPRMVGGAAAVVAVLLLAVLAAATTGPWELGSPTPDLTTPAPAEDARTPAPDPAEPPTTPTEVDGTRGLLRVALTVVGAVTLAVLIRALVLLARRALVWRTAPPQPPGHQVPGGTEEDDSPELPVLRRGVAQAQEALDQHPDPHDAVVAAWLAVEHAAADAGRPRRPEQTSTELATEVLDATSADPAAVRELLGLYHRARYARGPSGRMTATDVARAHRCLGALAVSWRVRT
ncbi:DUF4129 domain-containing protein [Georgenia sp. 10Sc9-8]|uniref:DUF4129 domain-containing protein n=1 Tax=Georgenia halotolerans TaxID=3028317 RepID=A0ABT5TXK3_9MICO|nr:DUF4129 domain-containing protein [Georgenia halotolerans]